MRILVLCTGNSCRSQMAEGFIRAGMKRGSDVEVYSAGIVAHGINSKTVQVMHEIGIDISNQKSENVDKYIEDSFDLVITVCDNARENCPNFTYTSKRLHHNFPDPANAKGTEEEKLNQYRKVRDEIKYYCENIVKFLF